MLDKSTTASKASREQLEAGNYKKQSRSIAGLDISIENPAGSRRSGTDRDGNEWSVVMRSHYGYIKGTVGKDKDHLDCFVKVGTVPTRMPDYVYVVNQRDPETKKFDEHKVMIGWEKMNQARKAYYDNYDRNWKGLDSIVRMDLDDFKDWMKDKKATKKPAPKGMKKQGEESQKGPTQKNLKSIGGKTPVNRAPVNKPSTSRNPSTIYRQARTHLQKDEGASLEEYEKKKYASPYMDVYEDNTALPLGISLKGHGEYNEPNLKILSNILQKARKMSPEDARTITTRMADRRGDLKLTEREWNLMADQVVKAHTKDLFSKMGLGETDTLSPQQKAVASMTYQLPAIGGILRNRKIKTPLQLSQAVADLGNSYLSAHTGVLDRQVRNRKAAVLEPLRNYPRFYELGEQMFDRHLESGTLEQMANAVPALLRGAMSGNRITYQIKEKADGLSNPSEKE